VHTGTLVSNEWSKLVCFAGLGPGEVVLDGQKVVGVSQRRTRVGARLQTTALGAWRPDRLVALTRLDREQAAVARLDITPRAVGVGRSPAALADAFVASIG
jgi:lipoate-protein ligase A